MAAYDTNAAYHPPPRRQYGGYQQQQPPQQAPGANGYGYSGQEQHGYEQGQQNAQQGYGMQEGYGQDEGYDQRTQYYGGYDQGYVEPQQRQMDNYGQQASLRQRQYDPRYQQRAAGGRQQGGYTGAASQQQRPPHDPRYQQQRQPAAQPPAGYEQRDQRSRSEHGNYVNGNAQPQSRPQQDPRAQQSYQNGAPMNGYAQPRRSEDQQRDPRAQQDAQLRQKASRGQLPRQPAVPAEPSPPVHGLDLQSKPNPANIRQYNVGQQQLEQQKQAASKQRAQGMTPQPQPQPMQSRAAPQVSHQSPPPAAPTQPGKMTMEEWKAKAKAKMHADAARPEVLAQDNAFPTFPTYEHKSKGSSSTHTTEQRPALEHARPSTSNGVSRSRPSHEQSRNGDHSGSGGQHSVPRPSLDHKPYSSDAVQTAPAPQSPPHELSQPQYPAPGSAHTGPVAERAPQNWPVPSASQPAPPPQMHSDRRQPPTRGPQMQPLDIQQAQQHRPTPAFMDHQPLSPATIPPRPGTAQGGQPFRQPQQATSPTGDYGGPPSQDQQYSGNAAQPPKPWSQQTGRQRETLMEIYDDYHSRKVPPPQIAPTRSREEEIEAAMPDFDSAAPGGTSLLHKKSQKSVRPSGEHDREPAVATLPAQQPDGYGQPPKQQVGITHGFAFGIPGEQAPSQQPYDDPYQQQGYPPQQQQLPPVQPPYANEHIPRRSMDDARQMPYRQGPPHQQRPPRGGMPPNGQPPRGPMPPHMRPDMDRGYTNATVRSGPGPTHRGGSAPPMQPGMRGPPPGAGPNGTPVNQQRPPPTQPNMQQRHSNPDSLPKYPTPVRPGLTDGNGAQPAKPPPVRNYNGTSPPQQPAHTRQPSLDPTARPVTHAELDHLRAQVATNPNNHKATLHLAKRLVEASTTLAPENGRLDQRAAAKNRERYILDAHKLIKRLVAASYPDAQFYLADAHSSGNLGLEPDPREAFNLYQAAAKGGHPEAAFRTAMCCELGADEGGGTRRDYAKALQWYRRAATLGDPQGAFKLGVILLKGLLGQPRNVGEAVTWLTRAVDAATPDGPQAPLYEMALLHESSNADRDVRNKVVPDDAYALQLFTRAAEAGHKGSQFRLGQAYEYGALGLPIDNRASITWYTRAAAQGEHGAELALSGWYLTGADGILEQSDTEAYLWARKAAGGEPPLAKAMFAMGYFTEMGIGCPASLEEARRWYGRAASYKFPKAQERLEELRKTGGKGKPAPANGKLARKDQKRDEAECSVM